MATMPNNIPEISIAIFYLQGPVLSASVPPSDLPTGQAGEKRT